MKTSLLTLFLYITTLTFATPISSSEEHSDISIRSPASLYAPLVSLYKRKGGGGGKGGGGSGSSGGGGRTGGGIAGSGRPASSFSFSSASNLGGRTRSGSGPAPAYGGKYIGGAAVPYSAGARSPTRKALPFLLPVAGLAIFPGIWLYASLYSYPYGYGYYWLDNGRNRTSNVTCLCQQYSVCGCDDDGNQTTLSQMLTNGTGGAPVNTSTIRTVDNGNGNITTYINGTLPNGTTASGGSDPSNEDEIDSSFAVKFLGGKFTGWWVMVLVVSLGVLMV